MSKLRALKCYLGLEWYNPVQDGRLSHVPAVVVGLKLFIFAVCFECLSPELMSHTISTRLSFYAVPTSWRLRINGGDLLWRHRRTFIIGRRVFAEQLAYGN